MKSILDPIEFVSNKDGQLYNAVFDGFFDQSPNHCSIFLNSGKIGDAVWYHKDGLIDRIPYNSRLSWGEICDRIERDYEYCLKGHERAVKLPKFITANEELLDYEQGKWTGFDSVYNAAIITGYPINSDNLIIKGTFVR